MTLNSYLEAADPPEPVFTPPSGGGYLPGTSAEPTALCCGESRQVYFQVYLYPKVLAFWGHSLMSFKTSHFCWALDFDFAFFTL